MYLKFTTESKVRFLVWVWLFFSETDLKDRCLAIELETLTTQPDLSELLEKLIKKKKKVDTTYYKFLYFPGKTKIHILKPGLVNTTVCMFLKELQSKFNSTLQVEDLGYSNR